MDIASLSTAMSTQNILNDVRMVKIMESSVTPYLGQNIDYYV